MVESSLSEPEKDHWYATIENILATNTKTLSFTLNGNRNPSTKHIINTGTEQKLNAETPQTYEYSLSMYDMFTAIK